MHISYFKKHEGRFSCVCAVSLFQKRVGSSHTEMQCFLLNIKFSGLLGS